MAVEKNVPEVQALLNKVLEMMGRKISTHKDYVDLSIEIEQRTGVPISESTLERMWDYSTRCSSSVSNKTLNILSKAVGAADWEDFKDNLSDSSFIESNLITEGILDADTLGIGTKICLTWLPDRECVCKYLGGHRFIVEGVKNAHLCVGDTFSCIQFQQGRELSLDKYFSEGGREGRYIIGQKNGLVSVKIVQ